MLRRKFAKISDFAQNVNGREFPIKLETTIFLKGFYFGAKTSQSVIFRRKSISFKRKRVASIEKFFRLNIGNSCEIFLQSLSSSL